jgi:outer membrane protein assembly factor BamB
MTMTMMKTLMMPAVLSLALCCSERATAGVQAETVTVAALKAAGFERGVCLVVGETDGKLTAALAAGSKLYVQGCTRKATGIQAARKALVSAGVAARSSIIFREDAHLPYADNLINLLVCPNLGSSGVSAAEVLRVLTPGGVAYLGGAGNAAAELKKAGVKNAKTVGGFLTFTKPLDPDMADWTHIKAGADQSYTNSDRVVGPWKEIRWIASPRWGSLYVSYGGLVSAGGRIYYKENRASKGANQWHLVARDAYNGIELWRVNSGPVWRKSYYTDYTLTCDDSRVYLLEGGKLVARDGKTGKKVKAYSPGFSPRFATASGRFLLASTRGSMSALDKSSGQILWKRSCAVHPAAGGGAAFVMNKSRIEAVEISTGRSKWKTGLKARFKSVTIMHKAGVVYVVCYEKWGNKGNVVALDAKSGSQLWTQGGNFKHTVLPYKDEVWFLGKLGSPKGKKGSWSALVLDPRTGKEKRKLPVSAVAKCFGARGAADYLMYMNGVYVERKSGKRSGNRSTRSPCRLGQHPANGLTYFMPHHCDCGVTLRGFLALSKPGARKWFTDPKKAGKPRLFSAGGSSSGGTDKPDDWPIYRGNLKRGSSRSAKLPAKLKQLWSQKLGSGRLTQATGAYGMVFAAERISGRVFARDAASGKERWSFVADGRVECPPTLYKGMCLFGTGAGSVYCLDARSGKKLWRLRAAPIQKFIGDHERLDSPWPVNGGVLVMKGRAHFSVGRSKSQSGGLWLFGVDVASGAVRWRLRVPGSGDMVMSDGKLLRHVSNFYNPAKGKQPWIPKKKRPTGLLYTTRYLNAVSVVDFMATVEPNLSHKKHIALTNGRIKGSCIAFGGGFSVAGWRYGPMVPGTKKGNYGKYFLNAAGGAKWRLDGIKQHVMGIVIAGDKACVASRPGSYDPKDKSELWVVSLADGKKLSSLALESIPVYDGLSAVGKRLYLASEDGTLTCYGK